MLSRLPMTTSLFPSLASRSYMLTLTSTRLRSLLKYTNYLLFVRESSILPLVRLLSLLMLLSTSSSLLFHPSNDFCFVVTSYKTEKLRFRLLFFLSLCDFYLPGCLVFLDLDIFPAVGMSSSFCSSTGDCTLTSSSSESSFAFIILSVHFVPLLPHQKLFKVILIHIISTRHDTC